MFDELEARLERVSMRYAEEFAARLARLVDKDAPIQYASMEREIVLLREHIAGMRQSIIDGLTGTLGDLIVRDHIGEIDIRIDRFARAIVQEASATASEELPLGAAFGVGYKLADEAFAEQRTPVADWVRSLHGGQLVIVLGLAVVVGLALFAIAGLAWLESSRPAITCVLFAGAVATGLWTLWALWIWLGDRRARATLPVGTQVSAMQRPSDPMDRELNEHLAWSVADLRKRYREVQSQRLDIILPRINRGELDRDAILTSEMDEARRHCAALFQVLRDELIGVAAKWCDGTLAVEAAVASRENRIMDAVVFIKVSTFSVLSRRLPLPPLAAGGPAL